MNCENCYLYMRVHKVNPYLSIFTSIINVAINPYYEYVYKNIARYKC